MMKSLAATVSCLLLVAICLSTSASANDQEKMEMREVMNQCAIEANLDPAKIKDMFPPKNDEEQRTLNCLGKCAMENMGLMIGSEMQRDKINEKLDGMEELDDERRAEWKTKAAECAELTTGVTDPCDAAGAYLKCWIPFVHPHGKQGQM